MELNKIKKIYMIGIKGVGMTSCAQYLKARGVEVVGSDIAEKFMTDRVLRKNKIKVIERFDKKNIPKDADLIIYSSAYNADNNEEVEEALKRKVRVLTYAQALGEIFSQKYGIAVAGSHGKTTTTAWLGFVMSQAGLNPSVLVGASVPQFGGAALISNSDYLVIEADEYQNKFTNLHPKAVVLNNIDYDHPDFFKTEEEYKNVFIELIKKIPKKGFLVANFDDPVVRRIARVNCQGKVITYAINEAADYVAYSIKQQGGRQFFKVKLGINSELGSGSAELSSGEQELGDFSIGLIGKHNISNALAVIAVCIELGVELVDIRKHLSKFTGAARRMQVMGEFKGATIIDDYAHHPTEIKTTLAGARDLFKDQRQGYRNSGAGRKIIVVFHPHTFTRTKALLNDFAKSFNDADEVIILDIYGSAREKQGGVSSKDLVDRIRKQKAESIKQKVRHIPTLKECEKYLRNNVERGDVVILMGAGDVFRIGERLVK
jgi:UDP-N-acetylmuramate--alanine ligase